jgi:hypothetical protein
MPITKTEIAEFEHRSKTMNRLLMGTFAAALLSWALPAAADLQTHDPGIEARQHRQQARIVQGLRSGELSRAEAHRLEREQAQIRHKERIYKADGVLTAAERRDLERDLNRADRHIYNQKHDADRRF